MPTLTTCRFDSPGGAEHALRRLECPGRRVIAVQDAAVVAWAERDPKPRAYQARSRPPSVRTKRRPYAESSQSCQPDPVLARRGCRGRSLCRSSPPPRLLS